ncbi:MAG TPA: ChaN family lipoprotein [Gallionella sp.]|nr:ChaN family lipoprotein [Gallionella sp.]
MTLKRTFILALALCCAACGQFGNDDQAIFHVPPPDTDTGVPPKVIDPVNRQSLAELTSQLADKRAIFIGEIHDRVAHHQNQLRIIKSLYAQDPDLAIGVEYFQQPFQPYLDDYIDGRIDERQMLVKTEYFKRWQLDYRMLRPIFEFAREKHIPVIALNISDEIHNKVFRNGMKSLSPGELAETPAYIEPASKHYLQRLKAIFDTHPRGNDFNTFVEGVLLWDSSMADTAALYLKGHPKSRMVILAGLVHVMYGDGIPERVDLRLGGDESAVLINGNDFGGFPGIADYQLVTGGDQELPQLGKLGVAILDGADSVYVTEFTPGSAAQAAGIRVGDHILALNDANVANMMELRAMMYDKMPGDRVQVDVLRSSMMGAKKEMRFEVTLH